MAAMARGKRLLQWKAVIAKPTWPVIPRHSAVAWCCHLYHSRIIISVLKVRGGKAMKVKGGHNG